MNDFLKNKTQHTWQTCGFYKSNVLIDVNYDLPNVWQEFKTIDVSDFGLFYYQCCLNLSAAIEQIANFKGGSGNKLTNELARNFKVGPKNGNFFFTTDVDLSDLIMIDLPTRFQRNSEEENSNFQQLLFNSLRKFINSTTQGQNNKSRRLYAQEDFAAIIIQFIQFRSTDNSKWDLILNQQTFIDRICKIVDEFLKGKNSFDYELIQTLISKIDNALDDYNNDLKLLGLSLAQEATSIAHKIAFQKTYDLFTSNRKSEAYVVHDLWLAKRDELLTFFVSQLAPDQAKDEENAKQFIRTFVKLIENTLKEHQQTIIQTKLGEIEDDLSRLQFQNKRDATLTSLNSKALRQYVLDPSTFIFNDFKVIWSDFKSSLSQEFSSIKSEQLKLFDELKNLFTRLNDIMDSLKTKRETFKAQELFRTTISDSEKDIIKNVYFKVLYICNTCTPGNSRHIVT